LYTAQKSNSHYAQQPYTDQTVFKSLLNCASEMSLSRNATGREFQRHGPVTEKLPSSRRIRVLTVGHVKTSADHRDRRPMSVKSWQSSARYCGSWPCNALCTRRNIHHRPALLWHLSLFWHRIQNCRLTYSWTQSV